MVYIRDMYMSAGQGRAGQSDEWEKEKKQRKDGIYYEKG